MAFDESVAKQDSPLSLVSDMVERVNQLHASACEDAEKATYQQRNAVQRRDELQMIVETLGAIRNKLDGPGDSAPMTPTNVVRRDR